ncbi:MAG: hypothetical protein KJN77_06400 [Gammaproteobacteria bacterium]|nr:hypothetical protein [Gammaproteobacteria bacterium]
MGTLINWFKNRFGRAQPPPRATGSYRQRVVEAGRKTNEPAAEKIDLEPRVHGSIETIGPGKNVYVRSERVDEGTGSHDALELVDEPSLDSDDADGVDPYNTGRFDRPGKWNSRSRR